MVRFGGLRIAGLSGIFKHYHFEQGFHERIPYTDDTKRSIYHIREYDVHKLSLLHSPNIFMSHDWPTNIHRYGDYQTLLREKPFFRDDIERGGLGSPPAEMLLKKLRPAYWFSAHLHVKFAAVVNHGVAEEKKEEEGEINLEGLDEEQSREMSPGKRAISSSATNPPAKRTKGDAEMISDGNPTTRFLALDKCLPRRDFLQILDIGQDPRNTYDEFLSYDPEWLALTKTFHPYLSVGLRPKELPPDEELLKYI